MHIELTFVDGLDHSTTRIIKASSIKEVWKPGDQEVGCRIVTTNGKVEQVGQPYRVVKKLLGVKL